jgi:Matrixin
MRRLLLLVLLGLVLASLVGGHETVSAQTLPSQRHPTVSVTGYTQSGTHGTRVDITLDVPPGADGAAIAQAALARRGARPVAATGLAPQALSPLRRWPQFFDHDHDAAVPQYYNPAGDPTPGGAAQALQSTEQEWTNVHTATFALQYAGTSTRGAAFDGVNVVTWPTLWVDHPLALAVAITTFQLDTGFILDADVIMNRNVQFVANPADLTPTAFDVRFVMLHENGHVAGLEHSANPAAVMFPVATSGIVGQGLTDIDVDAISRLYPLGQGSPQQPPRRLRDFSAAYAGSIAFSGPSSAAYTASGSGTYVGQSRVQGRVEVLPGAVTCPGQSFNTLHNDTITAANGDLMYVVVRDVSCETPPGSGVYRSAGAFTIFDGTGQFIGATGQGNVDIQADFNTHAFSITYSGAVSQP